MNAVEIEEAVSELATQPFDAADFPFAFLRAFGRKDVELQRLRKGNASDVLGGVLRRDSIHMATCAPGGTGAALTALRESPKTAANRVKFIIATAGVDVQAEECATGEVAAFPLAERSSALGRRLRTSAAWRKVFRRSPLTVEGRSPPRRRARRARRLRRRRCRSTWRWRWLRPSPPRPSWFLGRAQVAASSPRSSLPLLPASRV